MSSFLKRALRSAPTKIFGASKTTTFSAGFQQSSAVVQARHMNIHEYQSHDLMKEFGVAVPQGASASTPEEAFKIAQDIGTDVVVKAQILAGGRGMGVFTNGFKGGVHKATSPEEVKDIASKMLGENLVTKQSGAAGKQVNKVYVCERVYARRELYFAIMMDRSYGGPVLLGSSRGGMNIEEVARDHPQDIHKMPINIHEGIKYVDAETLARKIGCTGKYLPLAAKQIMKLYELFIKTDATLLEINPLVETPGGEVLCADAKLNFDDNAEFRQKEIFKLHDRAQDDSREVRAAEHNLNYIGLDGNIGCIVNGAGLAMATMDIIQLYGGSPANFLDVGGGATQEQICEALKILNDDPQVNAILVNIFGGIMRCDIMAYGIVAAAKSVSLRVPLVIRLKGTNYEEGKRICEQSGMRLVPADDLDAAAQKAVVMANIVKLANAVDMKVQFEIPI